LKNLIPAMNSLANFLGMMKKEGTGDESKNNVKKNY
jgi:hypothetical protein